MDSTALNRVAAGWSDYLEILKTYENRSLKIDASVPTVCMMVAQLQVALRHPENNGDSAAMTRDLVIYLIRALGQFDHRFIDVLMQGFNPDADLTREEADLVDAIATEGGINDLG